MGLPTGDDYVDELVRSLAGGGGAGQKDALAAGDARDSRSSDGFDFDAFARRERRREREYHAAWDAICRHADFANFREEELPEPKPSSASTRRLAASDTLAAVRALGIASANAEDANAMIALLERRNVENERNVVTKRNEGEGSYPTFPTLPAKTVGYAEFKKYAALLPSAQLRDNAAWNWLDAATGPRRSAEQTPPRAQPAKQLFAGGLAGVAARTAVAPLDRARTIMQDLRPGARGSSAATVGTSRPSRRSTPAPPALGPA